MQFVKTLLLLTLLSCGQAVAALPSIDEAGDPAQPTEHTISIPSQAGASPSWSEDNSGRWRTSTGNGYLVVPISTMVGDELVGARYLLAGNSGADVSVVLYVNSVEMFQTTAAYMTVRKPGSQWIVTPMDVTAHRIADNEAAFITFLASSAGIQIGNVSVTYRR